VAKPQLVVLQGVGGYGVRPGHLGVAAGTASRTPTSCGFHLG
jgi:hypothetical protein